MKRIKKEGKMEEKGQNLYRTDVMTIEEAMEYLRMTRKTLLKLSGEGKIDGAVKIGKLWRYSRRRLFEMIEGKSA
jgi:excisionase family DNA binding protein